MYKTLIQAQAQIQIQIQIQKNTLVSKEHRLLNLFITTKVKIFQTFKHKYRLFQFPLLQMWKKLKFLNNRIKLFA